MGIQSALGIAGAPWRPVLSFLRARQGWMMKFTLTRPGALDGGKVLGKPGLQERSCGEFSRHSAASWGASAPSAKLAESEAGVGDEIYSTRSGAPAGG